MRPALAAGIGRQAEAPSTSTAAASTQTGPMKPRRSKPTAALIRHRDHWREAAFEAGFELEELRAFILRNWKTLAPLKLKGLSFPYPFNWHKSRKITPPPSRKSAA